MKITHSLAAIATTAFTLTPAVTAQVDASASGALRATATLELEPTRLDWEGTRKHMMMYMPSSTALSSARPAGIRKEPEYRTTPRFGTIALAGKSFALAVDEPAGETPRIWIDLDGDGDLTDDGDGSWAKAEKGDSGSYSCQGTFVFAAGTDDAHPMPYGLNLYYAPTRDSINYYRAGARTGSIEFGGETYEVSLIENDNDARFDKLLAPDAEFDTEMPRPVWLMLDGGRYDIRGTFSFGGMNLQATVAPDGSEITLEPTFRVIGIPRPKQAPPKLIAAGAQAPEYRARIWRDGAEHDVALSDFEGEKVVVLDLWATWCGPCRRGLPHLSKLAEATAGQDVEIIALNVFDEQAAYDAFRIENDSKWAFTWARDPAGKERAASVAARDYHVSGIPATFVIDKTGKIVEVISGFDPDDRSLEKALAALGIDID